MSASNSEIYVAGPNIGELEIEYVCDALAAGWYGVNAYRYVEQFEREFAELHGRKFGLMTTNCTSAMHLTLAGLGVGEGDEVIVPESTWIGSSAGISYVRAQTVFADINPATWCISRETLAPHIGELTRAVIAVNLYGNMPNWEELESFSRASGIPFIEDAAESLGSSFRGRRAGAFGVASVFSFHRTKTLSTGEGGMLLTDDPDLFERCKFLRDHGRAPGTYFNTEVAFKYMPFNVQAALGLAQLHRISELVGRKRELFHRYRNGLTDSMIERINIENHELLNGAWATCIQFSPESGLTSAIAISELSKVGIPIRPFFYPLSSLPAYSENVTGGSDRHPHAYHANMYAIQLPGALNLSDEQVDFIVDSIQDLMRKFT